MFEQQQIFQSKIDIKSGGSSISDDFPVTLNIMSQSIQWKPVFWDSEKDVALSGKKRSNIRGYDVMINLDYDRMLEPDKLKTILDGIVESRNQGVNIEFYPDASNDSEFFTVIPSGDTSRLMEYEDTLKKGESPSLSFESDSIVSQVDSSSASPSVGDADTLDGLDSTQFLRSDADDVYESGNTLELRGVTEVYNNLDMKSNRIQSVSNPVNNADVANKAYVDKLINGLDWQESVIDEINDPSTVSPSDGDRYLVGESPVGDFSGHSAEIAIYDGSSSSWEFVAPDDGTTLEIESNGYVWIWNGTDWVRFGSSVSHNQLQDLDASDHMSDTFDGGVAIYDESTDKLRASSSLTEDNVATTDGLYEYWTVRALESETSSTIVGQGIYGQQSGTSPVNSLTLSGGSDIEVYFSTDGNDVITIDWTGSVTDTDNFINGSSWNGETLTLTMGGDATASDVPVDLSRFALDTALSNHTSDTTNPHDVTYSQVNPPTLDNYVGWEYSVDGTNYYQVESVNGGTRSQIRFSGGTGISISTSGTNNEIISIENTATSNTDNFIDGSSWSSNVLTLTMGGSSTAADVPVSFSSLDISVLNNDAGYITSAPVDSVNGETGAVNLSASDVDAVPASGGTFSNAVTFKSGTYQNHIKIDRTDNANVAQVFDISVSYNNITSNTDELIFQGAGNDILRLGRDESSGNVYGKFFGAVDVGGTLTAQGGVDVSGDLTVIGSLSDPIIRQTGDSETVLADYQGGDNPVPWIIRASTTTADTSTSFGVLEIDRNGDGVGGGSNLHFRRQNSNGDWTEYAGLGGIVSTNTAGSEDGDLRLYTTLNGNARQTRLIIKADGNVGIGTTSPTEALDVSGSGVVDGELFVGMDRSNIDTSSTSARGINIYAGSTSAPNNKAQIRWWENNTYGMAIGYDGSGTGSGNQINIYNTSDSVLFSFMHGGSLGINMENPSEALDVNGNINLSGTAYGSDFDTSSDRRLKSNFEVIDNSLDIINHGQLQAFDINGKRKMGLIAQDMKKGHELLIGSRKHEKYDEVYTIHTHALASLAVQGVKDVNAKVETNKEKIERLEQENKELRQRLNEVA